MKLTFLKISILFFSDFYFSKGAVKRSVIAEKSAFSNQQYNFELICDGVNYFFTLIIDFFHVASINIITSLFIPKYNYLK